MFTGQCPTWQVDFANTAVYTVIYFAYATVPVTFCLQEVEGWLRTGRSSKLERAYQNLKTELHKLQPPPNLVNVLPDMETIAQLSTITTATTQETS